MGLYSLGDRWAGARRRGRGLEITAKRMRHIADNFDRYRQMAENPGRYESIRRGMRRKPGEPWTPEALNVLVNDWRLLEGAPRGRMWALEDVYGIDRGNILRALTKAEKLGLLEAGEVSRRPPERNI